jgi:hypothetical protein
LKYAAVVVAILLVACENAEKKAARLRQEYLVDCFEAKHTPFADSAYERIQARCDVANRDYNAFMNGR